MTTIDLTTSPLDARLALVDFDKATPNSLQALTEQALQTATDKLDAIEAMDGDVSVADAFAQIETFNTLSRAIERAFGVLSHLNSVASTDDIRHAHHEVLPKLSAFGTRVGQSKALYQLYQTVHDGFEQLPNEHQNDAQRQAIKKALQSFVLSGVALDDAKKAEFADIQSKLSLLSAKFSDNLMDATRHYTRPLTTDELSGISDNGLALLKAAGDAYRASHPDVNLPSDYVATLDIPMYLAVISFADSRALREEIYHAYNTRASDQSPDTKDFDNSPLMTDIINLRTQKAKLLGMADYSEYSLATKMAENSQEIEAFLLDLSNKAKPKALAEYAELQEFAKSLGLDELKPWDVAYVSEKIRQAKFSLTSDELRPYFPLPVVLDGLFDICRTLFGVVIEVVDKQAYSAWHDDVLFCQLSDENSGELLGGLYLDLFARSGKQGGAWLDDFQKRNEQGDSTTLPVGFIVGNFAPPVNDKPSLLSFDEANTLFHEFGHALHHLLTEVGVADVAGISGVEWDAVELPSQFMENFAITDEGLQKISRHIDTGEPLPSDKKDALIRTKNFQTGLQTLRQMEFGLYDLRLHSQSMANFGNVSYQDILAVADAVRQEIAVVMPPAYQRFGNGFSHIFAGGYACGYYSYIWAEVLSSDAFGKFEEDGIYNPATGRAFRAEILARGSSRDAKDNYLAFRGRKATNEALLRHRGLA
ncbi:oligopeptidase A [Moraxella pluranimalium]|uniref:oligopeptidase A n=2 Tax=Moraxella pluranimalium TaxID=470453 RepID=A0A1T0CLS2_9GAMM|nr:M3 family metallopeptidase [Moraxella pluranimalium]OOS23264.1 oligopeptidase A [Moraxella pluranimalium]